jgi:DNA mismatch repair protein MutL
LPIAYCLLPIILLPMTQKRHIAVLPVNVANKIAAGEVVDRPASILKELLENSLDAGASQIDVEIVSGGRKLVSVSDNGYGMIRDDAILSTERQATSKIKDVDDIEKIATLGFRGEALAAIASVSRFRLTTNSDDADVGTEVRITGGKMYDVVDFGCPTGTTVEVRDIFFNVPARRKFLRTYQTEQTHVRSTFIVQALAHPEVGMSLKVDGRELYRLVGKSTLEERIRELFGQDYNKNLLPVSFSEGDVKVTGFTSLPAFSRSDRAEQYVFINGRAASAALISFAIREGYHRLLPERRQPCVFLFIELPPELVDVNVHPTKKEVRFRKPNDVRDTIISGLKQALTIDEGAGGREQGTEEHQPEPVIHRQLIIQDLPEMPVVSASADTMVDGLGLMVDKKVSSESQSDTSVSSPWKFCRIVGQMGGLYVVLETEDGYVMMDPHAAHERILFEKFMTDVVNSAVQSQNLLMPETVKLTPKDAQRVRKNLTLFSGMGFGISDFGGDTFVIDALPSFFATASAETLLNEIAHSLDTSGKRGGTERWREESVAQAACKTAVKARDKLNMKEIEKLVLDLSQCDMPYTCPHGRPTMIYTAFKELNRKFARE